MDYGYQISTGPPLGPQSKKHFLNLLGMQSLFDHVSLTSHHITTFECTTVIKSKQQQPGHLRHTRTPWHKPK